MENELKNSDLVWCSKQICYPHPKWFAENVEGFHQRIDQMLKIIEEDGNTSADRAEIYYQKRLELIPLLQEITYKHQLLAEQYDHLVQDLHDNISSELQAQDIAETGSQGPQDSSLLTPDQKFGIQKIERQAVFDFPLSSGGTSSNVSRKEGSEFSSLLSSDSDSESSNLSPNKCFKSNSRNSGEILKGNNVVMETGVSENQQGCMTKWEQENGVPNAWENGENDMMLLRITQNKEALRDSNKKFLSMEEENMRLKSELENALVTMDNWKAQLETANNEVKMMEVDLDMEKRKVSELQMQAAMLETKMSDSNYRIGTLVEELEVTSKRLGISEEEIAELKHDISGRDSEIRKLNVALQDALRNFEMEKARFQSYNSSLSENLTFLEARLAEREEQIKSLENEIKKSEASKIEMKGLYEAQEIRWQVDVEGLKTQLNEQRELVESLNKDHDRLKLKYNTLTVEKDGLTAKVQTLGAELCSRDNNIRQKDDQLHQLQLQKGELIVGMETAVKLRDELRLKVEKLEKEVERQAVMVSDRAEEKREAIRQLCFSLEHYRSGYQELRQAYVGQRRNTVIAS